MGANQSKFDSLVQCEILGRWHRERHKWPCTTVLLPVSAIQSTSTTTTEEYKEDLFAKMARGWIAWCADHNVVSTRHIRKATLVAGLFGQLLWADNWQVLKTMWDSDEERAMFVMHMLEDEVPHPWQILRTLVKKHRFTSMEHLVCSMTDQFVEAKRLFKSQVCWHCRKGKTSSYTLRNCSGCGVAKYCTKNCQKMHWPTHKEECADFQNAQQIEEEQEEEADPDFIDILLESVLLKGLTNGLFEIDSSHGAADLR